MNLPGPKIDVLDHGYVQLVDVMGDDRAIVDAARVSIAGENVKATSEDFALIRYLLRHRHTTPFEMVEMKFRCKMPIVVARQWIRHRTANVNEMSGRYSQLPEEFYVPEEERITKQAKSNKQGSSTEQLAYAERERRVFKQEAEKAFQDYKHRLELGMARELARINLPLSTYTEWIWKIDLHNLFHFLGLRAHSHAQYEIRVYAEQMLEMVRPFVPIAIEAFEDYRLNAMFLSAQDVDALRNILQQNRNVVVEGTPHKTERERNEFLQKLAQLRGVEP